MGRADVAAAETRRRVAIERCDIHSLAMEPIVLARKHRVSDDNFRDLRKQNNCDEYDE